MDPEDPDGPTQIMQAIVPPSEAQRSRLSVNSAAKGHVLVVDADPTQSAAKILEWAGFRPQAAPDGVTATRWLSSVHFDCVVTDISTPGVDGLDLLRFAHAIDADLPVVLMTGAPDLETASEAIEHGAFQYLLKPVPAVRLVGAVERAVEMRRVAHAKTSALQMMEEFDTIETSATPEQSLFVNALNSLWLAYQPIIRQTGPLFAYEALVRSDEPDMASAGDILDAAERLHAITELGRRVRSRAGEITDVIRGDYSIFVNLHSFDLLDDSLLKADAPLSAFAHRVVLEITERAALHDLNDVKAKMAHLRSMGFRIALDDLGAGYAGLTSFAMLEPEIVKIDMGLVRDVDKIPVKRKLVASITQLSRDLGIQVVGEGVETVAERDVLIELGCDLLQGYLIGKPSRLVP